MLWHPTCCGGTRMELTELGDRHLALCKVCGRPAVVFSSQKMGSYAKGDGDYMLPGDEDWAQENRRSRSIGA